MRITAIEPLAALSPEEASLLPRLLEGPVPREGYDLRPPNVDPSNLVVYEVEGAGRPSHRIVAPASKTLRVGMTVICSGTQASVQRASSDTPETVELQLAEALIPSGLDL